MKYIQFASHTESRRAGKPERLVLALDASPSMAETDWPPSRLIAAVEAAIALILRKARITPDDQVGVVAYASSAWWLTRPAVVGRSQRSMCRALRKISTSSGTNIASALQIAEPEVLQRRKRSLLDRLVPRVADSGSADVIPRIILLTDGHHNTGTDPLLLAKALKNAGVVIDCVGIGGAPSDVDETLLRSIASPKADGVTPRYAFIGDKADLLRKFEELAGRITR